jgi:hypothetical protein
MAKPVLLSAVEYQMLLEVAKRNRKKASEVLGSLIEKAYGKTR